VVTRDTPSRRADAGVQWGSLVHGLLEHAMRHPAATRDDLRRLAVWLTVEDPDLRPVIEQALDTVQAVAQASFWTQARESAEVHEEAPFAARERDGSRPKVVNGVIDLVYRTPDGWRIVDYKTDRDADAGALAARYAEQVQAYERAWGTVSGGEVRSEIVSARSEDRATSR
jgi:ATP-dependent exoDNAse (exonuclease V) beta subunit